MLAADIAWASVDANSRSSIPGLIPVTTRFSEK
jgi:hypothetical protein